MTGRGGRPKIFEGYSDYFLRLVIKVEEGEGEEKRELKTDATGKDYYQILGLEAARFLNQAVEIRQERKRERKEREHTQNNLGYNLDETNIDNYLNKLKAEGKTVRKEDHKIIETYWLEETISEGNEFYNEIARAHKRKSLQTHPDKVGPNEDFPKVSEAFNVLRNQETKRQYDRFYRIITGETADPEFKRLVIEKLLRLARRTEETEGIQTPDSTGTGTVGGEDLSSYLNLFPSNEVIRGTVDGGRSKAGISRYANWVIHVYSLLRNLEDEVKGHARATINTARREINPTELGAYANFRKIIWGKNSKEDVIGYDNRVRRKIREVIHGKTSHNLYDWQDAQEENLEVLQGMRGWDTFSGPEDQQGSEQFHFVTGFSRENFSDAEPGITSLRFADPNHHAYRWVIERAKVFRDIKEKIAQKSTEFDNLRNRQGGNVNQFDFNLWRSELEDLGRLKRKNSIGGEIRDYSFAFTKMKFDRADSNLLKNEIDRIFRKFEAEIARVGAKPLREGDSSDGGGGSGELWREAIQEIENALRETGLKLEAETILRSDTTWRNQFEYRFRNEPARIESLRKSWLGLIYRVAARRKINQELNINSISINQILGPGKDVLKEHFVNFTDKASINAERDHLLALILDYGQGRGEEIEAAIAAVKNSLCANQLAKDPAKIATILGADWERQFVGLSNKADLNRIRDKFIRKIEDYVARDKSGVEVAIQEIENLLTTNNLPESILGPNWKDQFRGKNEAQISAELARLKKIIIANGGKVPELIAASQTSAINRIKNKLKEGHQKLAVREEELPSSLLAPYKTVAEKINSLNSLEDIIDLENQLREVIIQKKSEKLTMIANEAIAEIKKELGSDQSWIELGENRDYETKLKNATDPDVIEVVKQNVLYLIREQKGQKTNEEFLKNPDSDQSSAFDLETLGIIALILLPLALIGFVILRIWQKKSRLGKD